jgi:hypothetical protein
MTQSYTSPAAAARSQRRMWGILVLVVVLPLVGIAGSYGYRYYEANRELRQVILETEQVEPRWRLEDVEADRAIIPDHDNSGLVTIEAARLLPKDFPRWYSPPSDVTQEEHDKLLALQQSFSDLESQRQLNDRQLAELRADLTQANEACVQGRKLADLPRGRYPIQYADNSVGTLLPHAQDARGVARLLGYDALLRAQEGDADGALTSCRAILNAGRSVGDEPLLISLLVRVAIRTMAVTHTQRTLAQGQPSDAALAQMQQLFEKDETEPLLLNAIRGERAKFDHIMDAFQTGKEKLDERGIRVLFGMSANSESVPSGADEIDMRTPGFIQLQRTALLRHMNQAVEIAKLPPDQQHIEWPKLEATAKDQPMLVRLLLPALSKYSTAQHRSRAQLRCAAAALAAERYRMKKNEWPKNWDAVVGAGLLRETPVDVYEGKPLRLKRLGDGVVIYSIGPDGEDNGGKIDKNPNTKGTDIGFRLWDLDRRRQPAAPPKPFMADDLDARPNDGK